jgi:hypothetical protein
MAKTKNRRRATARSAEFRDAEAAYRRGYEQGVWDDHTTTTQRLLQRLPPGEVADMNAYKAGWLHDLHVWRYSHKPGSKVSWKVSRSGVPSLEALPPRMPHLPKRILPGRLK